MRKISIDLGVSESTIFSWGQGKTPSTNTLRRVAFYFTAQLGLPSDVLGDGKILLTQEIEPILKPYLDRRAPAQGLPVSSSTNSSTPDGSGSLTGDLPSRQISEHEKQFIIQLAQLTHGRPDIEISTATLSRILEFLALVGVESSTMDAVTRLVRGLKGYRESMVPKPDGSGG